jgi:hypothetical protein
MHCRINNGTKQQPPDKPAALCATENRAKTWQAQESHNKQHETTGINKQ